MEEISDLISNKAVKRVMMMIPIYQLVSIKEKVHLLTDYVKLCVNLCWQRGLYFRVRMFLFFFTYFPQLECFILSTLKQGSVEVCVYMCEFLLSTVIKSCLFGAGPSHYLSLLLRENGSLWLCLGPFYDWPLHPALKKAISSYCNNPYMPDMPLFNSCFKNNII